MVICGDGSLASSVSFCPYSSFSMVDLAPTFVPISNQNNSSLLISIPSTQDKRPILILSAASGTFVSNSQNCNISISFETIPNSVFLLGNTLPLTFGVNITIPSCVSIVKEISISFRLPGPVSLQNACLAFLNVSTGNFECVDRSIQRISYETNTSSPDFFGVGLTPHFTVFAIIQHPTPSEIENEQITSSTSHSDFRLIVGVIVGIALFILIVAIVAVVFLKKKQQKSKKLEKEANEEHEVMVALETKSEGMIGGVDSVKIGQPIGKGKFGAVYKGIFQDSPVALKKVVAENANEFLREAQTLKSLRHPNIVW